MKRSISLLFFITLAINVISQQYQEAVPVSSQQLTKDYIEQSLIYPKASFDSGIEGKVIYRFIIDEKGQSSKYVLQEGISEEANLEALRLIRTLIWHPALKNGTPVISELNYSVNFDRKKYLRAVRKRENPVNYLPDIPVDSSFRIYELNKIEHTPVPLFSGEKIELGNFIRKELKYPESAFNLGIQGTVKLGLIVETDGIASNIIVIQSVGGGCDNEAIRILQKIRWIPGIQNEKLVRSKAYFEVTFKINEYKQNDIPNRQSNGM
jgi:TonB family protein